MSGKSYTLNKQIDGSHFKIGIVKANWNNDITDALLQACIDNLNKYKVPSENITAIEVPGAFELPNGAKLLAGKEKFDAIICLGCVIKGDTKHDDYISNAVANGLMMLSISSGKPVIFGVVTTNDHQQALDRAGGLHGNKGEEAALTALSMVQLAKELKTDNKGIGFN